MEYGKLFVGIAQGILMQTIYIFGLGSILMGSGPSDDFRNIFINSSLLIPVLLLAYFFFRKSLNTSHYALIITTLLLSLISINLEASNF